MEHRIDGGVIHSRDDFYDAVAAALSFPGWFGRNLDALYDSLRDLSWLPPGEHVLVWSAPEVFERSDPEGYGKIVDVLADAAEPGAFRVELTR